MKLLCISLGRDKNLVDTEMMLGLLNRDGYTFTDDEYEADVIVINTCCFIGDAKEESVNTILEMAQMKEVGKCKALIVTGRSHSAINRRSSTRFRKWTEFSAPPPMMRYPTCWPRHWTAESTSSASTIWISSRK